jgi:ribokinase
MPSASRGRVVVVGSSNTDLTLRVPHIPAPGETVGGRDLHVTGGGKGANQAVAAARAGAPVAMVAALGTDAFGDAALERLRAEGIDVGLVRRVPAVASGVALIFVDPAGENVIAVAPGANAELRPEDVAPIEADLGADDVVLLQLEIPLETVEAAIAIARRRGARVILNPAPARPLPETILGTVAWLTPNEHEATHLTGFGAGSAAGLAKAARTLHERGVASVLVTLGARGAYLSAAGAETIVRGFAVDVVDTTAAGDVFNGALAVALIEGRPPLDAVRFANAAAALSVTRPGAQASAPSRQAIEALLAGGTPAAVAH